jgi:tetratricopeptide (TPR) repeat protein
MLLEQRGDHQGAEAAYRRADERGDGVAAANLGVLLEERGDLAGAEAAYRRADERDDATGAYNLAALLAQRGELAGAGDAYRRAAGLGEGDVAAMAKQALRRLGASGR